MLLMKYNKITIGLGDQQQPTSNSNHVSIRSLFLCLTCKHKITVPGNACAAHPSSWQEKASLIDSLFGLKEALVLWVAEETEAGAAKYSFVMKKACQDVFGVCLRLLYKPSCSSVFLSCLCLHCSPFAESNLTSEVESFSSLLAIIHHTHQLSWNINWKGKKAVRHFLTYQFDFRQR